jgi:signal transduction histidine kinase
MTQSGGTLPYEKVYLHTDGRRVPALVALSQLSADPVLGIVIVLDISDLKATQDALMERTQAAERAEAAKAMFLSSVSHELRTPLHTMLGHVRLMRKRASGEDLQQLKVVERSSAHLLRLIEDLLEYNHTTVAPERLEPDVVMLDGFLGSLQLISSALTADTDNQFFMQMSEDLPTSMVVDEVRLTQVLRILMDNACKYTRAGSLIFSLSFDGVKRFVDGVERCNLRFSIEDNGRGIDADDVAHIFEPLYRGSNAADLHGLGLGLAIAARWIKRMGSTIALETSRGLGSHFSFVLDLAVSFEAVPPSRELLRKGGFTPQSVLAIVRLNPLPQDDLNTLGELINMGRLGRLRDWAQALERRHPQHQEAAAAVGELAANADLDALEKLHGRWAALGCLNESNTTQSKE